MILKLMRQSSAGALVHPVPLKLATDVVCSSQDRRSHGIHFAMSWLDRSSLYRDEEMPLVAGLTLEQPEPSLMNG